MSSDNATQSVSVRTATIGQDGTVYVGTLGTLGGRFYAITEDGTISWSFDTGTEVQNWPALGADGTIYMAAYGGVVYAFDPGGTVKWSFDTSDNCMMYSPTIAADGTIYAGSYFGTLFALNPGGGLKWEVNTGGNLESAPAIGEDGTLYLTGYQYPNGVLHAISSSGIILWTSSVATMAVGGVNSSPVIATDGTIYVGANDSKLYAINPDGTLKWSFTTPAYSYSGSTPAIGDDGTIYYAGDSQYLYAVDSEGALDWSCYKGIWAASSPALGDDGTIYVGGGDDIVAINGGGLELSVNESSLSSMSPIWPMWGHDQFHTSRAGAPSNQPPNQPSNISPANAATGVRTTPTLQSSPFSDPDAGDAHIASQRQMRTTSGSYSSPVYDSGIDASNLTSIAIPSGLLRNSTAYYWRVRYQDNHGAWSGWSTETSFTTVPPSGSPSAPILISPANGANVSGTSVTFQWNASPGATKYYLIVSTNPGLSVSQSNSSVRKYFGQVNSTQYTVTGFPNNGTTYYWWVYAGNSSGWCSQAQVVANGGWSLVNGTGGGTPTVPSAPALSSPANGANVSGTSVTFQWNASPSATKYFLIVSINPSLSVAQSNSSSRKFYGQVNGVQYTVTGFPNNGTTYYWWVYAGNSSGWCSQAQAAANGGWSVVNGTGGGTPTVPTAPTLLSPGNGAKASGTSVTFQWNASPGATNYFLIVSTSPSLSVNQSNSSVRKYWGQVNGTQYTVTGFSNNGTTYYWWVYAGNSNGWCSGDQVLANGGWSLVNGP
jgi:outer membrane protein assembly factor BamB